MLNTASPSYSFLESDGVASARRARLLLLGLLLVSVVTAFLTQGTYDSGDSVYHYLYAHYAFKHPLNLLNSWAKPAFTLLAAGPAQFGFMGIKLFQCAVVAASAWCAYTVARALRLPAPELAILFAYAAPNYFLIQFSGLTEPLFGLLLVAAVALTLHGRAGWAAVVLSWLPFVRSEGFILIGVWVVYLALRRQWRYLPLLGLGYLVYSAIGAAVFGEPGWVFGRNPYATVSVYGHGDWGHFIRNIPGLLGWVLTLLFVLGGVRMVRDLLRPARWHEPHFLAQLLLVYGSIAVFIAAHTVFWAKGLFNSAGLLRVLDVTTPLAAVVALNGLAWLLELGKSAVAQQRICLAATAAVAIWPFTGARNAIRPARDFAPAANQQLARQAGAWYKQTYGGRPQLVVSFMAQYLAPELKIDPFDAKTYAPLLHNKLTSVDDLPLNCLVFWDEWFAPVEGNVSIQQLQNNPNFRLRWQAALPRDPRHPEADTCRIVVFERVKQVKSAVGSN